GDVTESQRMPEPFVVTEEEHLVFFNWSAQRTAKLIAPEWRDSRVAWLGLLVKEVSRIEGAVSQEFESCAMQLIGAGLRDHADLPAGALAVFGRIGIAEHVELPDGVNAQQLAADSSRRDTDVAAARIFNPIQQEKIVGRPPPGHSEIGTFAGAH